jgi:hypothetical protein
VVTGSNPVAPTIPLVSIRRQISLLHPNCEAIKGTVPLSEFSGSGLSPYPQLCVLRGSAVNSHFIVSGVDRVGILHFF